MSCTPPSATPESDATTSNSFLSDRGRSEGEEPRGGGRAFGATGNIAEMEEDRDVLLRTLSSFALYRPSMHSANQLRRTDYISLPATHKDLLPHYLAKLELADEAIARNSELVEDMMRSGCPALLGEPWTDSLRRTPGSGDLEKIRSTVKQTVRDWSEEGRAERDACYTPILDLLQQEFSVENQTRDRDQSHDHGNPRQRQRRHRPRSDIKVLTPGCGLGRLSFEIARLGFDSTGNEFSYHMLLASNHILNHTTEVGQYHISPFVHSFSNHWASEDMLRIVKVPDTVPAHVLSSTHSDSHSDIHSSITTGQNGTRDPKSSSSSSPSTAPQFSMAAGDFVESFGGRDARDTFDAVATCFFLDTAHNVLAYLYTIRNVLRDGGYWINLGPCLWHHEHGGGRTNDSGGSNGVGSNGGNGNGDGNGNGNGYGCRSESGSGSGERHGRAAFDEDGDFVGSIELSMQEVMDVVEKLGFVIELKRVVQTPYMGNERSMLQHTYHAQLFTARLAKSTAGDDEDEDELNYMTDVKK